MSFIDILKTLDKPDTYLHYLDCFKNCLKLFTNPIFILVSLQPDVADLRYFKL